jgi:small subunit ribosomal protein S14
MSLKFLNIKDNRRRLNSKRFELRNKINNFLSINSFLPFQKRNFFNFKLNKISSYNSFVSIKNRCVVTGSAKSCYSFFKLSRIQLKNKALNGFIFGLRKSSW